MRLPRLICAGLIGLTGVWAAAAQEGPFRLPPIVPLEAPAQTGALPLYPNGAPTIPGTAVAERWGKMLDEMIVRNVTQPTITPYLPEPAKANGAAVIVAPGGGFMQLSMRYEGAMVAEFLASQGIAAFVLKYRLEPTPPDEAAYARLMGDRMAAAARSDVDRGPPPSFKPAVDDGIAAMQFVRERAAQFKIDPKRVGMIGFSAGAMTALGVTLANQPDSRPDFVGLIYGPMNAVEVPAEAPPMFAAIAADDPLFGKAGFSIVESWRNARKPVELHVYQTGGHGFGIHNTHTSTVLWPGQLVEWMRTNRLLGGEAPKAWDQ
jgi:acetyl esterase/lipase